MGSSKTVADWIANYFAREGLRHAFGIIGAGNVALFDSIARRGYTDIICTHHEQAAAQAAIGYWRTCGKLAPVLLTTGAGSANAITGVLNAWMDAVPLLVISGNEAANLYTDCRVKGAQGYGTLDAVDTFIKGCLYLHDFCLPNFSDYFSVVKEATTDRFGPIWIDIPRNLWSATVTETKQEAA